MIRLYNELSSLEKQSDTWKELVTSSVGTTAFQSFLYFKTSWEHFHSPGDKPYVLFCYKKNGAELCAIMPCVLSKDGTLSFLNESNTDFCDIIVDAKSRSDYHIYEEIADYIQADSDVRRMCFKNIPAQSPLLAFLRYFLKGSIVSSEAGYSLVKVIAGQREDLFKCLPALNTKERYRLKNVDKKATNVRTEIVSAEQTAFPEEVRKIIGEMIAAKMREASYFSEDFISFLQTLYEGGMLHIALTKSAEDAVAASLLIPDLKEKNTYIQWIAIYKEKAHNLWNVLGVLKQLCEQGGGELNFARGWYPYKVHNFRPQLENLYTFRYAKGYWGQIKNIASLNFYLLKQIAKQILRK